MTSPEYSLAGPETRTPAPWAYWVVEDVFLAGAYPGSPNLMELRRKLRTLLDAGIATFINLMEETETDHTGRPFVPYDESIEDLSPPRKIRCERWSIRDVSVPTRQIMVSILDAVDRSIESNRPVYIHCWGGVGRTGTVVGCWLLRHGLATSDTVIDTIRELRTRDAERGHRESPETEEQRRFVVGWKG